MKQDTLVHVATIPSQDPDNRIAILLKSDSAQSKLMLCQQSWAEGIGWFTQSSVEIDPDQLPGLRQALKGSDLAASKPTFAPAATHTYLRVVG